ncbi:MAG: M20/M25/M40 family metallo-hydrolase [Thermoanaerobaculia bacterium]
MFRALRLSVVLALTATTIFAAEAVDLDVIARIRQEGFRNSQVMKTAHVLTDRFGGRLTGSTSLKESEEWSRKQLENWGLVNAHVEAWGPFGRGWENDSAFVRMVAPEEAQLVAIPKAWTPGTNGLVRGPVVNVRLENESDLQQQKGKLTGKIVFLGDAHEVKPHEAAESHRYDAQELESITQYRVPGERDSARISEYMKRREFRKKLNEFFAEEKPLAVIEPGSGDGGLFVVAAGGSQKKDEPIGAPMLVLSTEQYDRITRLVADGTPVELELDVRSRFLDDQDQQYNVIAEIPGTDKNGEVVIIGGHIDSWHAGTGATDNAAGVAAVMEAARILKAIDARPKRTIRVALWSGEEQGLLGSRGYVEQHYATWPEPKEGDRDTAFWRRGNVRPTLKPEQRRVAAYFNLDNGTGKIRGIYTQENLAVAPIFRAWLQPLSDLGATTVTTRNTGGTDHQSFDAAGIPAFQFIQDEIEYDTRTHHTNYDVYDRLQRDDLMQASVVIATFAWEAANRVEMLPRKPLPPK